MATNLNSIYEKVLSDSCSRLRVNWESIFAKFSKPFEDDPEVDLRELSITRKPDKLKRLSPRRFGKSKLVSTVQRDQTYIVDANDSVGSTSHRTDLIKKTGDNGYLYQFENNSEQEPSDGDTLSSCSSSAFDTDVDDDIFDEFSSKSLSESHSSTSNIDDNDADDDDYDDDDSNPAEDGTFISLQSSISRQRFVTKSQREGERSQKYRHKDKPVKESVDEIESLMYSGTTIESGIESTASLSRSQSEGEHRREQAREPTHCHSEGTADPTGLDYSKVNGLSEKDSGVDESLTQDDGKGAAKNSSRNPRALKLINLDDSNTWSTTSSSPAPLPKTGLVERSTTKKRARRIQPITVQCSSSSTNGILSPSEPHPSRQVGEKCSNATSKHLDATQVLSDLSNTSPVTCDEQRSVDRVNHSMSPRMKQELGSCSDHTPETFARVKCCSAVPKTKHGLVQLSRLSEVGAQSVPCKDFPRHQADCRNDGHRKKDNNCDQHIKPILCSKMEAFKELKKSLTFRKDTNQHSDRKPSASCSWQAKCKASEQRKSGMMENYGMRQRGFGVNQERSAKYGERSNTSQEMVNRNLGLDVTQSCSPLIHWHLLKSSSQRKENVAGDSNQRTRQLDKTVRTRLSSGSLNESVSIPIISSVKNSRADHSRMRSCKAKEILERLKKTSGDHGDPRSQTSGHLKPSSNDSYHLKQTAVEMQKPLPWKERDGIHPKTRRKLPMCDMSNTLTRVVLSAHHKRVDDDDGDIIVNYGMRNAARLRSETSFSPEDNISKHRGSDEEQEQQNRRVSSRKTPRGSKWKQPRQQSPSYLLSRLMLQSPNTTARSSASSHSSTVVQSASLSSSSSSSSSSSLLLSLVQSLSVQSPCVPPTQRRLSSRGHRNSGHLTSAQSTSVQSTSVQSTSVQSKSVQSTSVQSTSVQSKSVQSTSVQSTSVQSTSVQSTSVQSKSVQSTSVQSSSKIRPDVPGRLVSERGCITSDEALTSTPNKRGKMSPLEISVISAIAKTPTNNGHRWRSRHRDDVIGSQVTLSNVGDETVEPDSDDDGDGDDGGDDDDLWRDDTAPAACMTFGFSELNRTRICKKDVQELATGRLSPMCTGRKGQSALCTKQRGHTSPGTRQRGQPSPGTRQRGHPSPGTRLKGHPSPDTRLKGHSSPDTRLKGHPSPDTRQRGHPSPGTRLKGHSSPDTRLKGHSSPDTRLKGHQSPDTRLKGHQSPDTRLKGHPSPDTRLKGHPSPDTRLKGHSSPDTRLKGYPSPDTRLKGHPSPDTGDGCRACRQSSSSSSSCHDDDGNRTFVSSRRLVRRRQSSTRRRTPPSLDSAVGRRPRNAKRKRLDDSGAEPKQSRAMTSLPASLTCPGPGLCTRTFCFACVAD